MTLRPVLARRDFIRTVGEAAAAITPLRPLFEKYLMPRREISAHGPARVLVLGAGLAGLSAGYELVQAGHEVIILEARARPGGRVFTLRDPFSDGLYAEAGAGRIPDNHDLTLKYVRHFGLTLDPFRPGSGTMVYRIGGKRILVPTDGDLALTEVPLRLTDAERQMTLGGLWEHYVTPSVEAVGDPKVPGWPGDSLRHLDRTTFARFLKARGASPAAVQLLELPFYRPENDRLSALWWLRDTALAHGEKSRYKIRGGNDLLPAAFARELAGKIHYGAAVRGIAHDGDRCRVAFVQGQLERSLAADFIVCALPFSTLRRVKVTPGFGATRQKTIAELPYDPVSRLYLQVRKRFWETSGMNGFAISDRPDEIWHASFDQPGARGLLVSYAFGPEALKVDGLSPEQRTRFMVEHMESVFPGSRDAAELVRSFSWQEEEWSRGAYAFYEPGQMFTLLPHIATPEGRIHFAGEHTSPWHGWMQGALHSGIRAAREIGARVARGG